MHLTANLPRNLSVKEIVNRLGFDRIMVISLWPRFWPTLQIIIVFLLPIATASCLSHDESVHVMQDSSLQTKISGCALVSFCQPTTPVGDCFCALDVAPNTSFSRPAAARLWAAQAGGVDGQVLEGQENQSQRMHPATSGGHLHLWIYIAGLKACSHHIYMMNGERLHWNTCVEN